MRHNRSYRGWPILFAGSILFASMAFAAGPSEAPAPTIADLAWMAGDWEILSDRTHVEEHWIQPSGGTMLGMGRTVAGDKTLFFEYLRLESRPEGIFYVAHPKARPGVDFKLVKVEGQSAVFENLQHDFPKRISYRKNPDGSLTARVEGDKASREPVENYHYKPMARS